MVATSPSPRRITTPRWFDLRLVLGVVLVLAAVALGAALFSRAGDTAPVVTATHDLFASWEPQSGSLQGLEFRVGVDNVLDRTYRNALDGENGRGLTGRFTVARVWDF